MTGEDCLARTVGKVDCPTTNSKPWLTTVSDLMLLPICRVALHFLKPRQHFTLLSTEHDYTRPCLSNAMHVTALAWPF